MACEVLDYALHAIEFSTVVSLAYIGFDKAGTKQNKIEVFAFKIQGIYEDFCNQFDPIFEGEIKESLNTDEFYILARIAKIKNIFPKDEAKKIAVKKWYNKHCPWFDFFYCRGDYYVALAIFGLNCISFYGMTWIGVAGICVQEWVGHVLMTFSVVSLGIIFYFVTSSHQMFELAPKLDGVKEVLVQRLGRLKKENINSTVSELEKTVLVQTQKAGA